MDCTLKTIVLFYKNQNKIKLKYKSVVPEYTRLPKSMYTVT